MRFKEFLAQESARFDEELALEGVPEVVRKNFSALAVAATVAVSFISAHQIVKMDTEQLQRNKQIFSQIEKAAAEAERQRLKALQDKAKQSALEIASKSKDSGASADFGKYEHARKELEDFAKTLQVKYKIEGSLSESRVHLRPNPGIKPRGAPEEPARAFDKKFVDRSVMKKLADKSDKFFVVQGEVEWFDRDDPKNDELFNVHSNYMMIQVMGGTATELDISTGKYHGINVILPLKATKFELDPKEDAGLVTGDPIADKQAKRFERAIVKAALDALKKNDVPGIYSGLGGHEYTVGKGVGGIAEWETAQLSKLKNTGKDEE